MKHGRPKIGTKTPWRDADTLYQLYHVEGLTARECGDKLGCTKRTVLVWMDKLGIPKRLGRRSSDTPHHTLEDNHGYEVWTIGDLSDVHRIGVHRLVAVANGADPEKVFGESYHVHHDNRCRIDNRPENLEVLTKAEHARKHQEEYK